MKLGCSQLHLQMLLPSSIAVFLTSVLLAQEEIEKKYYEAHDATLVSFLEMAH